MTYTKCMNKSARNTLLAALILCLSAAFAQGGGNCIEIRNSYFWDPLTTNYWVPHGFAYQTINGNVFANQSKEQLDYDMLEMRKMHADSLRVDFTWGNIETADNVFDWTMTDHIVAKAEELGFRLFPLIGYQYAPTWSDSSWRAVNSSNQTTALLNYEHPLAHAAYTDFLSRVTARYKDSKAIAGWILGNEYAYFDLWEANNPHLFVGYDTGYSLPSFRAYLTNFYAGSISALNANWGTAYANFEAVLMPTNYPGSLATNDYENQQNRYYPAYHDLIQWRKKSVGDFVAIGSAAVKAADTNHLRSYSMVGGIYSGFDANNTCEDAKTIVARCLAAGAGLDFWSINNYAWASQGNELRTAQYGITKYQDQSGLPVLVTETGHSSTDDLFPGTFQGQAKPLPGQVWEVLMAGGIGTHIFTWNDRPFYGSQYREYGFGIVQTNRLIKSAVYWNIVETFRRMEQVNVHNLFGGSRNPATDINWYWSSDADLVWGRANQENAMLWGGLKRLGYEPNFVDEDDLDAGTYTNAPALLLSHAFMMQSNRLSALTNVIASGVNLHANGVLPGRYDPYHKDNPGWAAILSDIFGLSCAGATNYWHGGVAGGWDQPYSGIFLQYSNTLGALGPSYPWTNVATWIRQANITGVSGTTIVNSVYDFWGTRTLPGLQIKGHGEQGRAAINTFTLGDTLTFWWLSGPPPVEIAWQLHYDWGRAIYRDWFGIIPQVDVSGAGYFYVVPDYRTCTNGSVLISLLNESSNNVSITVTATNLMKGKTVERLSSAGGIMESNSDGVIDLTLSGNEYVLIYAYTNNASLVNPSPNKIWFVNEPAGLWPNGQETAINIGRDIADTSLDLYLALESEDGIRYAWTNQAGVSGKGTNRLAVIAPDADLGDTNYLSSPDGGRYTLHAWLQNGAVTAGECRLSTRLAWGAKPASIPSSVTADQTYQVTVNWQELPSYKASEYPTPLNRASVWQPALSNAQPYTVFLDLMTGTVSVASSNRLTYSGTGTNEFSLTVPGGLTGPFWWRARTVSGNFGGTTSNNHDVVDGFENRSRGDSAEYISPWEAFAYAQSNFDLWARGVDANSSEGTNAAFVIGNNYNPGGWSGIGMARTYSEAWALPEPKSEWSNIWFAFDFRETNVKSGTLTMKVEDGVGAIEYTTAYSGGGWVTISNKLSNFTTSAHPGTFNSNNITKLSVLLQSGTQTGVYFCSFDNIRFVGTPWQTNGGDEGADTGNDLIDSFEDRTSGEYQDPTPWTVGCFGTGGQTYYNFGYGPVFSDGSKGCWWVYGSHTDALGTSAYYMAYTYANSFALPTNLAQIGFSFDFYEESSRNAKLEMQVKDSSGGVSSYSKTYTPGSPWDTMAANLDEFSGTLDPNDVKEIAILIYMLDYNTTYVGHLDNIRFTGTVSGVSGPITNGLYLSINDSGAGSDVDTDGDGIRDEYETDTGTYNGLTDTGTDPNDPDSDDDGVNDGDEVVTGTNPNEANVEADFLQVSHAAPTNASGFLVEWFARTGRVYSVHYLDGSLVTNAFQLLGSFGNITVPADGLTNVVDTTFAGATNRFYRVGVRLP